MWGAEVVGKRVGAVRLVRWGGQLPGHAELCRLGVDGILRIIC